MWSVLLFSALVVSATAIAVLRPFSESRSFGWMYGHSWASWSFTALLTYFTAQAWQRDNHSHVREQLALTPVSVSELLTGKLSCWLLLWSLWEVVSVLLLLPDVIWRIVEYRAQLPVFTYQLVCRLIGNLASACFVLGLVSRLTILGMGAVLSTVLSCASLLVVAELRETSFPLLLWMLSWPGRWVFLFYVGVSTSLYLGLAVWVCWGLPRRVADWYGFSESANNHTFGHILRNQFK